MTQPTGSATDASVADPVAVATARRRAVVNCSERGNEPSLFNRLIRQVLQYLITIPNEYVRCYNAGATIPNEYVRRDKVLQCSCYNTSPTNANKLFWRRKKSGEPGA